MSLVDDRNGLSAADVAAVVGNNNGGFGYGDNSFWFFILFLFAIAGNGWGFGGNGMNGGVGSEVQRGFDQQAVMGNLSSIMQAQNTNQAATVAALNTVSLGLQNCCCENRAAVADLKYTMASESATTRAASQANTQAILDKLCQLELDGIKQNYENRIAGMQNQIDQLRSTLADANNAASQTAQTARILADNAAQTVALEQYLNPTPVPAYVVQNPNCCTNVNSCGCNSVI